MSGEQLANKIDSEKSQKVIKRVESNSIDISEVVDSIVSPYCAELDSMMNFIKDLCKPNCPPPTDAELSAIVLELPALLYYASEGVEKLGIREDVSKAIRKEIYNLKHREAQGTVPDKQTEAEMASQQEYLVQVAYERSYKIIKLKLEAGYELLSSTKKIMSARMAGMQLSSSD